MGDVHVFFLKNPSLSKRRKSEKSNLLVGWNYSELFLTATNIFLNDIKFAVAWVQYLGGLFLEVLGHIIIKWNFASLKHMKTEICFLFAEVMLLSSGTVNVRVPEMQNTEPNSHCDSFRLAQSSLLPQENWQNRLTKSWQILLKVSLS